MRRWSREAAWLWTLRCFAAVAGIIVVAIFVFLVRESIPAWTEIGPVRFVSDPSWHPADQGTYNLLPALCGTLLVAAGAVAVATPWGILAAIFCRFYAPPVLAGGVRRMIELMAGIPSVVYGFWGLVVLVPLIGRLHPPGPSLLAGIAVLSLMILPTIALMAEEAFGQVPQEYRHGAAALGLSRRRTVCSILLPATRSALATAVLLAVARAIGETMAVLMVCGNVVQIPGSLFDPVRTLTANIALEMGFALEAHRAALFVSGLVLLSSAALLVGLAEFISRSRLHA